MLDRVNFLFGGVAAEQALTAAIVVAESPKIIDITVNLYRAQLQLDTAPELLSHPKVARFFASLENWKEAFLGRDAVGFHHHTRKVANAILEVPDEHWQRVCRHINPKGLETIPISEASSSFALFESLLRAVMVPVLDESLPGPDIPLENFRSQPLQGIEVVEVNIGGNIEDAVALEFLYSFDLISNVHDAGVLPPILEAMREHLHPNFKLVIHGDSRAASDVNTVARVFLPELGNRLSVLKGLRYVQVEFISREGKGNRIYENIWAAGVDGLVHWVDTTPNAGDWSEMTPEPVLASVVLPALFLVPALEPKASSKEIKGIRIVEISEGKSIVCHLDGEELEEGFTLNLLTRVFHQSFARFPHLENITVDISLSGVSFEHPLAQTWELMRQLPKDIFPSGQEIGVTLKFNGTSEVRYGFFNGEKDLRRAFYDGEARWEVLEIKPVEGPPYELLTRSVSRIDKTGKNILGVELYVDTEVQARAKKTMQEVITDASAILGLRKGLNEIILVVDLKNSQAQINNVMVLANGFAVPIFRGNAAFAKGGIVVLVLKQPLRVPKIGATGNVVQMPGQQEITIVAMNASGITGWVGQNRRDWLVPPVLRMDSVEEVLEVVGVPVDEEFPQVAPRARPVMRVVSAKKPPEKRRSLRDLLGTPVEDIFGRDKKDQA